jgi:hypothetical protein
MVKLEDLAESKSRDVDLIIQEVALVKQLIKERSHPLSLLRELVSNAGAKEVGATEIRMRYTVDEEGQVFEVIDNGCGMNYTGQRMLPGRLDKFLGLGLSTIVGVKSDEFSWKGLGSKLAYQSRGIEIDTWCGSGDAIRVEVNEPWDTIERNLIPRPKIFMYKPDEGRKTGTSIKVFGHPPHRAGEPFTEEEIKRFLLHRTFIGFTRERENSPKVSLSVLGQTEIIEFGFPELKMVGKEKDKGTVFVSERKTITKSGTNRSVSVYMKGFYTWNERDYGLEKKQMNTGLILSVKGIPYIELNMEAHGSRNLRTARPGVNKCCLIVECDQLQEEMNISRSGLVDSENTDLFRKAVSEIFEKIESSQEYLKFRRFQEEAKIITDAESFESKKQSLESENQRWVIYQSSESGKPVVLLREPENENDVLCLLWKLEAISALPFKKFQTLGHVGSGPDLVVHFQEDAQSAPDFYTYIEIEKRFYNYKIQGHILSQNPRVICWEIGRTPKISISKTDKKYKHTTVKDGFQIHIFSIRLIDGIKVIPKKEFSMYGL